MNKNIVDRVKYVLANHAEHAANPDSDPEDLAVMPYNATELLVAEIDRMRLPVSEQIEDRLTEYLRLTGKGNMQPANLIMVEIIRLIAADNVKANDPDPVAVDDTLDALDGRIAAVSADADTLLAKMAKPVKLNGRKLLNEVKKAPKKSASKKAVAKRAKKV